MKTIEQGKTTFATWIGNATALPVDVVHSLIALQLGYTVNDRWRIGHIAVGDEETQSLFYNAVIFVRIAWPFGIFIGIRWSGSTTKKAYLQTGTGWALNGRWKLLFRIQSDPASAAGVSGPNSGQAVGWEQGTK